MPSLPTKGIKGQNFKIWAVDSINKLIDYLSSPYLQPGQGINIRRTPSGTVIELQKQPEPAPQNINISGGTSSVNGMVYPDWAGTTSSGTISLNSPFVLQNDAWIYVTGVWESISTGRQLSTLNLVCSISGSTQSYRISAFRSINSEETDYFSLFLPVKKGTSCELVSSLQSSVHTLFIVDSAIFYYNQ